MFQNMHYPAPPAYQSYGYPSQYMGKENILYVGDLEESITHETLYNFFIKFGALSNLRLMYDSQTNRSRGFAFVTYANAQDGKYSSKFS